MIRKASVICGVCSKPFLAVPANVNRGRGKFCSVQCTNKSFRNGSLVECSFCKTLFYRSFGNQRAVTQFCSTYCVTAGNGKEKRINYLRKGSKYIHVIVAENFLGRSLRKEEIVHHIDENKRNNDFRNLAVLPNKEVHHGVHFRNYNFDKYKLININP